MSEWIRQFGNLSGDFIFDYAERNKDRTQGKTRDEIIDMFVDDLCEIGRKMEEDKNDGMD